MRRSVEWSETALNDLANGIAYIAARNLAAARKIAAEMLDAGNGLKDFTTGRRGRIATTYEKIIPGRPYITCYALDPLPGGEERVVILSVIHTSRDCPEGHWPKLAAGHSSPFYNRNSTELTLSLQADSVVFMYGIVAIVLAGTRII